MGKAETGCHCITGDLPVEVMLEIECGFHDPAFRVGLAFIGNALKADLPDDLQADPIQLIQNTVESESPQQMTEFRDQMEQIFVQLDRPERFIRDQPPLPQQFFICRLEVKSDGIPGQISCQCNFHPRSFIKHIGEWDIHRSAVDPVFASPGGGAEAQTDFQKTADIFLAGKREYPVIAIINTADFQWKVSCPGDFPDR